MLRNVGRSIIISSFHQLSWRWPRARLISQLKGVQALVGAYEEAELNGSSDVTGESSRAVGGSLL